MFYRISPDSRTKYVDLDDHFSGPLFLCGGHPSLADYDFEKLKTKNATIMAMNNAATVVEPNIWIGADKPECYSLSVIGNPRIMKFARLLYATEAIRPRTNITWGQLPNTFFYGVDNGNTKPKDYLKNVKALCWWRSVFTTAIHLAYKLGFREIYLCGTVFALEDDKEYAYDVRLNDGQKEYNRKTYDATVRNVRNSLPALNNVGVKLISCSPNSQINEFLEYVEYNVVTSELVDLENDLHSVKHSSEFVE